MASKTLLGKVVRLRLLDYRVRSGTLARNLTPVRTSFLAVIADSGAGPRKKTESLRAVTRLDGR